MAVTVSQQAQYKNLETPSPVKMSGDKRHRHEDRGEIFHSLLIYSCLFLGLHAGFLEEKKKKEETAYSWLATVEMEHELAIKITSLSPP